MSLLSLVYHELNSVIRQNVESGCKQPSSRSLIIKTVLSLLFSTGTPLLFYTPLGKMKVVNLTRLPDKIKIMAIILMMTGSFTSLICNIMKFSQEVDRSRMQYIYENIKNKIGDNEFIEIEINEITYCIDKTGVYLKETYGYNGKTQNRDLILRPKIGNSRGGYYLEQ